MGFFSRRKEKRAAEVQIDDALLCAMLGGEPISKEKALQVPTVSGGIDLIAGVIAGTPIKLYRDTDGKAEEVKDDPRLKLLNDETGDTLNANEFWRAMIRDYYTGKGGYAYIRRERGKIKSLHYVDEARISIIKNNDAIYKDFDILVDGQRYKPYEFFRVLRNTRDGAEGVPITQESSKLIEVAYRTLIFEGNLIKKGGNKKGFLQSEKKLGAAELAELRTGFNRLYSLDTENAIVLNNGMKFQESSNTSVEMQLNENKQTNAREFAKIFHVSPEVMEGQASAEDTASLAKLAAIPLMVTIQCALNRDLLLEREKGKLYWAFDTKELLRGDMGSRFAAYKTALDANFMQIDEVRYAEDLEPLGLNWIKLGLQDVLYDPKTKRIYTPNTNQTGTMGEGTLETGGESAAEPLQDGAEDGTMEPRAGGNPNHGADGRFTSGPGGGAPNWSKKEAKLPFDYWELSGRDSNFPRRWTPKRFSHESTYQEHADKHMASVGATSKEEYERMAKNFLTSPRGKYGDAFVRKNGDVCRYDYDTKLFAIATIDGTIKTFWNLADDRNDPDAYWEKQKRKESR